MWARGSADHGTQDVLNQESDAKEKRGPSCIAICKVERFKERPIKNT